MHFQHYTFLQKHLNVWDLIKTITAVNEELASKVISKHISLFYGTEHLVTCILENFNQKWSVCVCDSVHREVPPTAGQEKQLSKESTIKLNVKPTRPVQTHRHSHVFSAQAPSENKTTEKRDASRCFFLETFISVVFSLQRF